MSGEEADTLYNALKEIRDKITVMDKEDVLKLDEDEAETLETFVIFMDDLFSSW